MAEAARGCVCRGLAGALVAYMAARLGLIGATQLDRTPGGVVIAQFLFGLVWAFLGHRFFRR